MNYKETWQAEWDDGALHISGTTDLFPNDFSTSTLTRIEGESGLSYRIAFHRDKEPYCNNELIGPVHYVEHNIPGGAKTLKVFGEGNQYIEFPIPKNT